MEHMRKTSGKGRWLEKYKTSVNETQANNTIQESVVTDTSPPHKGMKGYRPHEGQRKRKNY